MSGTVVYSVPNNWGAGFIGAVAVTAPAGGLVGWQIEFDAAFDISNIWNAVIVSHVGDHYVIRNASWNGTVAAGQQVTFGFQASPGGATSAAADFKINGIPVGGEPPPPPLPTLAVADAMVTEGNGAGAELGFTVTLSGASAAPVTVAYATANGTATAGSDYAARSGTLTFAPGETTKTIRVPVTGDTQVEANETITLTLSSPAGATIADGSATGTIVNDDVLPTLAIADASGAEGDAAHPGSLSFAVTLSAASAAPVSVAFGAIDGSARAGSDYVAQSGTLTFAPGETVKVIRVATVGDSVVEANESFTVRLSAPSGATLADAQATGTILNDDVAPVLPSLGVNDVSVAEGDPSSGGAAAGWFSTAGNQIVDAAGNPVQIAGVNWFGFESDIMVAHGLWTRNYKDMMDQMAEAGFNTIRLPYSNAMLHAATPGGIDYSRNPDLQGLTPLQIMDRIIDYAGEIGLRVILDHHRSDAGAGVSPNGLWYYGAHTEAQWIADWQMLAARYADDPTVIGADLHNEPHAGTWGGGGATDWAAAAERAGNAIGDVNPNWLIFVEGVATHAGQSYWWGGNLMGVRDRPIVLDQESKLVYSAHDYPNSVYAQPWFQTPNFAADLPAKFDQMWGYIYREGIAPVYIGEFGTRLTDPKDAPWLEALTSYLAGDLDNDGDRDIPAGSYGPAWTYWSWNPNSSDTGGILADDWSTILQSKLDYLEPIQFDLATEVPGGEEGPQHFAAFTVTLSAAAAGIVTVDYHTEPGTAGGADFTAAGGTLTFAPGETVKTVLVPITPDTADEPDERFTLVLDDPQGATIGRAVGTATILDDDAAPPEEEPEEPEEPPPPSGGLDAAFKIVDSWNSGFNLSVTVENEGAAALQSWQIEIEMPYAIANIWNAEIVSRDADGYVIRNAPWNGGIGSGGAVSFGFIGVGAVDPAQIDFTF